MTTAHTPGPWHQCQVFGQNMLIEPVGGEYPIASVTGYYTRSGQTLPNLRLIAAAPDLLRAAVKAVLSISHAMDRHPKSADLYSDVLKDLHAAIAKTTGGTA